MMERYFNIAGPCFPDEHYMLPALDRLPDVRELVAGGDYFVVHAPRQTGKTTVLQSLVQEINAKGGCQFSRRRRTSPWTRRSTPVTRSSMARPSTSSGCDDSEVSMKPSQKAIYRSKKEKRLLKHASIIRPIFAAVVLTVGGARADTEIVV